MTSKLQTAAACAVVFSLTLTGCAQANTTSTETASSATSTQAAAALAGATYTNMGDEASLQPVLDALNEAGLPAGDVQAFAEQVRSLNAVAPAGSLVTTATPLAEAKLDDGTVSAATDKQQRLTNCRITVYTLAQSLISVGNTAGADTSQLFVDLENIEKAPALFSSNRAQYEAFYGWLPTTKSKDESERTADIEKYLSEHQVKFGGGKASVISVYVHDTLDSPAHSFIGHTGVLVETADGLLFVEKLAFDAPYRAVKLKDRAQLRAYLMSMYDDGPNLDYGSPILFENGAPLAA